MKTNYLLPNRFKNVGILILIPSIILAVLWFAWIKFDINTNVLAMLYNGEFFRIINTNIYDNILGFSFVLGMIFLTFSKEKIEDEYISYLRLESFQIAFLVNYSVMFFANIIIYHGAWLDLVILNLITTLIIYLIRFHYVIRYGKRKKFRSRVFFPNSLKKVGWLLLIFTICIILLSISQILPKDYEKFFNMKVFAVASTGLFRYEYFEVIKESIFTTLLIGMFLLGSLLVVFSKEKIEDEYIDTLRLDSFMSAIFFNCLLIQFVFFFFYSWELIFVLPYTMFTVHVLYIIRFNIILFKNRRAMKYEK